MAYYIRKMQLSDVNQATEIDREAFSTQWPPPNYRREMQNGLSHHIVAIDDTVIAGSAREKSGSPRPGGFMARISRWLGLRQDVDVDKEKDYIVGFAGLWIIADEAHVTAIAVREKFRGQKIGDLLMVGLSELAMQLKARSITLEVRVSNGPAQALYQKYVFQKVGLRRRYYTDNGEDALIMTIEDINSTIFQSRFRELKEAHRQKRAELYV